LSYDGTTLLSGHASGKLAQWDTGRRAFSAELGDLNAPITNLLMFSPFPAKRLTKLSAVVKPKLAEGNYAMTAQFTGSVGLSSFDRAMQTPGLPTGVLEDAIARLSGPVGGAVSSASDEKLRKENEELWKVVNEQRALQQKTFEKYTKLKAKSGGG
jgi:pre-rRNA-processing protein IPI3